MKYFQMTSWIWRHQDASPARVEAVVVQRTKASVDEVHSRLGSRTYDETLSRLVDEHYTLNQLLSVLSPLSEQFGNQSPVETLQSLLDEGRIWRVDQELGERWKTSLQEVESLLTDAAVESDEPATYLRNLLAIKRNAKRSHVKDYSKMALLELRRAKTTEAAAERFRRAVAAIMAYNDSVTEPEMRWYISPTVVVNLVGGRPSDVKGYLLSRKDELDAHHNKFDPKITPGYNRHPMPITQRIKMEEASVGTTVESLEEAAVAE